MAPRLLKPRSQTGMLKSLDLVEVDGKQYWLVDKHKRHGRWYKRLLPAVAGGGLGFEDAPMVLIQDGPALNTFTIAKSAFGTTGTDAVTAVKYTAAPGFFYIGKTLIATVCGDLSNIVTTPGTVTFQFMVGSVIAWTSGAINFTTTAHGTGFDSAVSNQFDLFVGFSISQPTNGVRVRQFALSALN